MFSHTVDLGRFGVSSSNGLQALLGKKQLKRIIKEKRFTDGLVCFQGMEIVYNDNHSLIGMLEEIFVRKVFSVNLDTQIPYIIDCGANIGLFSIFMKMQYPSSEIIAFEPDPNICKLFNRNIKNNDISGVTLYEKALWTSTGMVKFKPDSSWGGKVIGEGVSAQSDITVPCVDIASFLDRSIDFLKIDIEGAEEQVIEKNMELLLRNLNYLVFEWHSHSMNKQSLGKILYAFERAGFSYKLCLLYTSPSPRDS